MESNWRQIQVQLRLGLSGSRDWEQHVKSWAEEARAALGPGVAARGQVLAQRPRRRARAEQPQAGRSHSQGVSLGIPGG